MTASIPLRLSDSDLQTIIVNAKAKGMAVESFIIMRATAPEQPILNYVNDKETD